MYLKTTVNYTNLLHYTVPAYRAHTRSATARTRPTHRQETAAHPGRGTRALGRASRSPQTEQALRPCNKHRRSGAPRTHRHRGYTYGTDYVPYTVRVYARDF